MTNGDAWATFDQVNGWIRLADAKATALLATSGVLGGLLVSAAPGIGHTVADAIRIAFFIVATAAVALSALVSLLALLPRLGRKAAPESLIYFDHIAQRFAGDRDGFIASFATVCADAELINRELGSQIWTNSGVARRKFRGVTWATWLLGVAMLSAGVSALLQHG